MTDSRAIPLAHQLRKIMEEGYVEYGLATFKVAHFEYVAPASDILGALLSLVEGEVLYMETTLACQEGHRLFQGLIHRTVSDWEAMIVKVQDTVCTTCTPAVTLNEGACCWRKFHLRPWLTEQLHAEVEEQRAARRIARDNCATSTTPLCVPTTEEIT